MSRHRIPLTWQIRVQQALAFLGWDTADEQVARRAEVTVAQVVHERQRLDQEWADEQASDG